MKNWFSGLRRRVARPTPPHRQRGSSRLTVERLEDRSLLSAALTPELMDGNLPAVEVQERLTTADPNPMNRVINYATGQFSGVVFVQLIRNNVAIGSCSGSLLLSGRHVLSAAHCVAPGGTVNVTGARILFHLPGSRSEWRNVSQVLVHPQWVASRGNLFQGGDVAVMELVEQAPAAAERYDLYTLTNELFQGSIKVGYGRTGHGNVGDVTNDGLKRFGWNRYDAGAEVFGGRFFPPGSVAPGTQLAYDFDNGLAANDAFRQFYGIIDGGFGNLEVNSAPGDSGGPTFISGLVAGITSYGFTPGGPTDIRPGLNSSFGEFSGDTRVSRYARWINNAYNNDTIGVVYTWPGLHGANHYLRNSVTPGAADNAFHWNVPGYVTDTIHELGIPIAADWFNTGRTTVGWYNRANGQWVVRDNNGSGNIYSWFYGGPGWRPVVGYWNNDDILDIGVYGYGGYWLLKTGIGPGNPNYATVQFGNNDLFPVTGDWDGDGRTSLGVVSPQGWWYLTNGNQPGTTGLLPGTPFQYGPATAATRWVTGDWNGDGRTGIGAYLNGGWYLRNTPTPGLTDYHFVYGGGTIGTAGFHPIIGNWDGNRIRRGAAAGPGGGDSSPSAGDSFGLTLLFGVSGTGTVIHTLPPDEGFRTSDDPIPEWLQEILDQWDTTDGPVEPSTVTPIDPTEVPHEPWTFEDPLAEALEEPRTYLVEGWEYGSILVRAMEGAQRPGASPAAGANSSQPADPKKSEQTEEARRLPRQQGPGDSPVGDAVQGTRGRRKLYRAVDWFVDEDQSTDLVARQS